MMSAVYFVCRYNGDRGLVALGRGRDGGHAAPFTMDVRSTQDVEDLVPQLANRSTSQAATKQLQSLGPAAAPLLMKHMGEANSLASQFALARVIAELKNPEVAPLAARELKNVKLVRNTRFALEQIAASAGEKVVPLARDLLQHESADVRQSGLRLLLRAGSRSRAAQTALESVPPWSSSTTTKVARKNTHPC